MRLFDKEGFKDIFLESLEFAQKENGLILFAYVIMPNHVHLIVETPGKHLGNVLRDIKQFTAKRFIAELEKSSG